MNSNLVFKNARLVLPGAVVEGSLSVVDGRIQSLDSGATAVTEAVDLEGDYLLPGLVEIHTDNFERHLMPRPKVQWAAAPALLAHDAEVAAAGITTVFDALGVGEADTDSLRGSAWHQVLETIDACAAQGLLRADHHLHVRCELPAPNTIELFAPFHDHPRLGLISLMDHTPGQRQWEDIEQARIYFTGKKGWSLEKFERQLQHSATLQAQYAEPHRAYFVAYCRAHGIALASHDDTTLARVGIAECHAQRASTLSGGQQQRAAIARTLVQGAKVVLADEPIASLDPESSRKVMDILSRINREDGSTVIVSLHQVDVALKYCPRVVALHQGQVVYDGPSAALTPALLRELYGMQADEILTGASLVNPTQPPAVAPLPGPAWTPPLAQAA